MVLMLVAPLPIGLLVRLVSSSEVHVVAMGVVFPLAVVDGFAVPGMAVVVVGIVIAGMYRASGDEQRD